MTSAWKHLESENDASANHILPTEDGGNWEARWVQRTSDYGIVYVSSHTGCALSCRFCHLTATGQTMMTPAGVDDYLAQLDQGLSTYEQRRERGEIPPVKRFHVNFMARGEALENKNMLAKSHEIFAKMRDRMLRAEAGAETKFLISSILPARLEHDLENVLSDTDADLYYSLYSLNPGFRRRWLPKAMTGEAGLDLCTRYQDRTGKRVALHWAFIKGQNDSDGDVESILEAIERRKLRCKFNLVRYNPHDERHGEEADESTIERLFKMISEALGDPDSRIVPRVGYDVKASRGMFVGERKLRTQPKAEDGGA